MVLAAWFKLQGQAQGARQPQVVCYADGTKLHLKVVSKGPIAGWRL
jgi:hypothetical protein